MLWSLLTTKTDQINVSPLRVIDNDSFKVEFYHYAHPFNLNIKHDTHKLILVMSLYGHLQYQSPLEELIGTINDGQFNLLYYPAKDFGVAMNFSGGEYILVHFDIHHWLSWLPKKDELRIQLQKAIISKMGTSLYPTNQNITAILKNLFLDIKQCQYELEYLKQYVNAKILELMVMITQPIPLQKSKENDLAEEEIEKMYKAKNIITKNIAESCSIITLAQQVGTNECYLKRNFKKVFGDSVYQYLLHERMEKAKDLLLNTDKKVSVIAKEIGYKNASHFSVAYKKHFGILPNQER